MRVFTFNLNGIRAAWRKGAGEWLQNAGADIVCMQEVRASAEDLSEGMRRPAGLRGEFNLPLRRGYSGVGLLAKKTAAASCPPLCAAKKRIGLGRGRAVFAHGL